MQDNGVSNPPSSTQQHIDEKEKQRSKERQRRMAEEEQETLAQKLTQLQTENADPEGKTAQEKEGCTIVVWGLNPTTTDECVGYYFENPRRSGGGPVKSVERLEETRALVVFRERCDAEYVLRKAQLKLDGSGLHASAISHRYRDQATDSVSSEVNAAEPDLSRSSVSAGNDTTDLDKGTSSGNLHLGSPLETETLFRKQSIPDLNLCKLQFLNNPKVLDKISKDFPGATVCTDIHSQTAHVRASETVIKQASMYVQSLVSAVGEMRVPLSPALSRMYRGEGHREWIQRTLLDHLDLLCHWELFDQSLIICAQGSSLLLLEQLFRSVFVEIKIHLEEWEVNLLDGAQTAFVERLQDERGEFPTPLVVLENDGAVIVDSPANISQTQLALRQFLDENQEEATCWSTGNEGICEEKQSLVCRDIPNLKDGQLKVLSCPTVAEKWYREYMDLQICVDQERKTAVIKASEDTMMKVFIELMYFVTLIREMRLPVSPACIKMYQKEDSRDWVHKILASKFEHGCHWEISDNHIVISGQSPDLFRLEQTFKSLFKEVTVHLEEWEVNVLTTDMWTSFVERQLKDQEQSPTPVLQLENDRVIIVDIPENVCQTQQALRHFLDEHRKKRSDAPLIGDSCCPAQHCSVPVLEDCIPYLKPGQLHVLSMPRALDKLYKQHSGLTVHIDRDRKMAVVRAPENIMQDAFSDVLCYVTHTKESKIPLSPALVQMYGKRDNREWIQQSLIDKYELICHWDIHDQHLTVSGSNASLQRLEQMFKVLFKEVKVPLDRGQAVTLTPSLWLSFVERVQKDREDGPEPVLLLEKDCITIVDIPSKVNIVQQTLKWFLNEHRQADVSCTSPQISAMRVEQNSISNLKPCQLRVLSCPTVLTKLYKTYPGLNISVCKDTQTAVVSAPESSMQKAFTGVMSFVSDVRELTVPLSPALAQMFEKKDSQEWIQKNLIDEYELVCDWQLCGDGLVLIAQSTNLFRLEHLFKSVFKEVKISLRKWAAGTLTSSVWRSYVRERERDRKGTPTPVLLLGDDSVTIVDVSGKVSETQLALIELMNDLGSL